MSYESLYSLERNLLIREPFNSSFDVQNNKYSHGIISSTGIQFQNGSAIISNGNILYNKKAYFPTTFTLRLIFTIITPPNVLTTSSFLTNNGTGIRPFGLSFINGNLYLNILGNLAPANIVLIPNFKLNINYEVVISYTSTLLNTYLNSIFISTKSNPASSKQADNSNCALQLILNLNSKVKFELLEIYNRSLSAAEVALLYKQQIYSNPI